MKKMYTLLSLLFFIGCAGSAGDYATSKGRAPILDDAYLDANGNEIDEDESDPIGGTPAPDPVSPNDSQGDPVGSEDSTSSETTPSDGAGECMNQADIAILDSEDDEFGDVLDSCFETCGQLGNTNDCLGTCLTANSEISAECAQCYNAMMNCLINTCSEVCNQEDNDSECESCVSENCFTPFASCSGIDPEG